MTNTVETAWQLAQDLRKEIAKAIIGQPSVIDQMLVGLLAAGHVLIEGVPGLGKTLLARAVAKAAGGQFSRVQFTSDLMPSDITGHAIYEIQTGRFHTRKGPVFCNVLLADEINRAPAKTQAALLEIMQERQVTIEGRSERLHRPFTVLATQNPIEQEGTYPLPEAQLDRFLLKILIDYPNHDEEVAITESVTQIRIGDTLDVSNLMAVTTPERVATAQQTCAQLTTDRAIVDYAVAIARASREHPNLMIGAGPRASIAMVRAARAHAVLSERDYVTPDDVNAVAPAVLRHRIVLDPESQMEGRHADALIAELLATIDAPRR